MFSKTLWFVKESDAFKRYTCKGPLMGTQHEARISGLGFCLKIGVRSRSYHQHNKDSGSTLDILIGRISDLGLFRCFLKHLIKQVFSLIMCINAIKNFMMVVSVF